MSASILLCPPTTTSAPVAPTAPTTQKSSWQLYPENTNYVTGQGYDTGGGVRKGPPPKKGPNPQVPPLLFSRGGGAAIRGTKFRNPMEWVESLDKIRLLNAEYLVPSHTRPIS